jgi:hypothetical protein
LSHFSEIFQIMVYTVPEPVGCTVNYVQLEFPVQCVIIYEGFSIVHNIHNEMLLSQYIHLHEFLDEHFNYTDFLN